MTIYSKDHVDALGSSKTQNQSSHQGPKPFKPYMEQASAATPSQTHPSHLNPSYHQIGNLQNLSFESLIAQTKSAQSLLADLSQDLNNKEIKLKKSEQNRVKSKLKKANEYLQQASQKLQKPYDSQNTQYTQSRDATNYIADYLDAGQANLSSVQQSLLNLMKKEASFNPAEFLIIQLKLAYAQQEIEYTSMMLSKMTDGLKTLMNIQL